MENTNVIKSNSNEKRAKLIFNAQLAKFLVEEKKLNIIGLKPNRENKDRTVFVFNDGLELRDGMAEYNKIKRSRKINNEESVEEEAEEPILMED